MQMEKIIGKYKILREIGRGGMAIVYKAVEQNSNKTFAIKMLLPNMVDRAMVTRFSREANALSRLKHPNILEVYEINITGGNHYFVMEFIDGESLKTIIKQKGQLPINQVIEIVFKVGSALQYAHNEGMIHRDIKPANIMISRNGDVKVMDFGLVSVAGLTKVTAAGSTVGTPEYMSPEQISGNNVDCRTDIYSLGTMIYEMLAGEPPFTADNYQAILMKHKYESPKPIKNIRAQISIDLENIINKAISKDVSTRYQHVDELLNDLSKIYSPHKTHIDNSSHIKKQEVVRGEKNNIFWKLLLLCIIIAIASCLFIAYYSKDNQMSLYLNNFRNTVKNKFTLHIENNLVEKRNSYLRKLEIADEHYRRGLNFNENGYFDEAIKEYLKAIRYRPDYVLYHKDLAIAYQAKGNKNKAIESWNKVLDYDSSGLYNEAAKQQIEKMEK